MTVLTFILAIITNAGHLGGGSGNNTIGRRRSFAICLALLRQVTEATKLVTGPILIPCGRLQVFPSLPPPRLSLMLCPLSGGR